MPNTKIDIKIYANEVDIISEILPLDSSVTDPTDHGNVRPKISERRDDLNAYNNAVNYGADWLEATQGKSLTPEQYQRLHEAGYIDYSLDDVFEKGFFNDWDDYLWFAQQEYADRPIRKQANKNEMGAEDYTAIKHGYRTSHLKTILKVANRAAPVAPEYYYDVIKHNLVMLGATALNHFSLGQEQDYLEWLISIGQLNFQRQRSKLFAAKVEEGRSISVNDFLLNSESQMSRYSNQRNKYNDLGLHQFRSYGHLILALAGRVDERIIGKMRDLGIGPGPWQIKQSFGSISNFLGEIEARNVAENWDSDFLEEYVLDIFNKHGEASRKLINRLKEESPLTRPSYSAIAKRFPNGLTGILEKHNLPPPPTKKLSKSELIDRALVLTESMGRVPITKELRTVVNTVTVRKNFGTISEFRRQVYKSALDANIKLTM